ncbi:MAG: SCP2 sterol-binding domain-containing protein [Candidatus Hydrogenedentes bacterium]|nr:SCP2 sterol-binding domain-containing protein [Candidatus Hydrogenedentota bacterium]
MADVAEIFQQMPERVNKDKIQGMNSTFQFNITGDGGGQWYAVIADGNCAVNEGTADSPNITITATAENWADIVSGKLNGQTAFLTGKLKIQGDMTLAMKLQTIFQFGAA